MFYFRTLPRVSAISVTVHRGTYLHIVRHVQCVLENVRTEWQRTGKKKKLFIVVKQNICAHANVRFSVRI